MSSPDSVSTNRGPSLLFVDDEPDLGEIVYDIFSMEGWRVYTAISIVRAHEVLAETPIDVIVSDLMLRRGSGLDLLKSLRETRGELPHFFFLTGNICFTRDSAWKLGINGVFYKPCDWLALVAAVNQSIGRPPRAGN